MPFINSARNSTTVGFRKKQGKAFVAPPGQQAYTVPGNYSWVAPAGVISVSVVAIGGGGGGGGMDYYGGGGGGLGYKNNYTVSPGTSYALTVGVGGTGAGAAFGGAGGDSFFVSTAVVKGGAGTGNSNGDAGGFVGDGGGRGRGVLTPFPRGSRGREPRRRR
jgi:hypothetical protein